MSEASPVLGLWRRFSALPLGRWLFGRVLGIYVPYAGSIGASVDLLEPGHARLSLADRRRVRNHLASLHAIALANLAELTGNLALSAAQPRGARWILTGLDLRYVKKARGRITAECEVPPCDWTESRDLDGEVTLRDPSGDVVAVAHPRWRIGPAVKAA